MYNSVWFSFQQSAIRLICLNINIEILPKNSDSSFNGWHMPVDFMNSSIKGQL